MATFHKNDSNVPINSKIIGVQFGVMGPEEIVKQSVVEITSHETYERDEPVIKGLFDPRMGVLDIGKICRTCGLKNKECPGHFGHLVLARPVYYPQFLSYITKIMKLICFRCSKLLVAKNDSIIKEILKKPEKIRFVELNKLCSKIKRCGQEHDCGCGCLQPDKYYKGQGIINLFAEWKAGKLGSENAKKKQLHAEDVHTIFSRISDEDCRIIGFNPQWCRPEWLICTVLPISPPAVRPSVRESSGGQRMLDDLTHKLSDIVKTNKSLAGKIAEGANHDTIESWTKYLQWNIVTLIDNEMPGIPPATHRSQRPIKSLIQRLKGKDGRIRSNLMGKRVDFSARSVITPDPNISIDELGVPKTIAMNLTFPEKVTRYNLEECKQLVLNGPDSHPGVNSIIKSDTNRPIYLAKWVNQSLETLATNLVVGDTINRHLIDGDVVLFNRQPSLHRMSMMGHRVKVMDASTFRLNVSVTTPYNADFDGDEMNMHVPQSLSTRFEIKNLAFVPKQIISPRTNKPIISIVQDTLLGVNKLTKSSNVSVRKNGISSRGQQVITDEENPRLSNCYYTIDQVMFILARLTILNVDIEAFLEKPERTTEQGYSRNMWSGLQLFTLILPTGDDGGLNISITNNLHDNNKEWKDTTIKILDSVLEQGTLDKRVFNTTSKGLIHTIYNKYGDETCRIFLDNIQRIVTQFLLLEGFSVGISDLIVDGGVQEDINSSINDKIEEVDKLIREVHLGIFEAPPGKTKRDYLESKINNILNKANSEAGKIARNQVDENNRVINMINSGSKGNQLNIGQMMACLGQQNVDGKRIPYGFENRSLPHYKKCDDSAEARGFVSNSFISGLSPQEYFFHAMGGREGLIDTAVKTSDTGYIQRKLMKAMEDLKVNYDFSVRSSNGNIVQFIYGDDGMDAIKIEQFNLNILDASREDITAKYGKIEGKVGEDALARILQHKEYIFDEIYKRKSISTGVFSPVNFPRIINDTKQNYKTKDSVDSDTIFKMNDKTNEECFINAEYKANKMFAILIDIYLHPVNLEKISEEGIKLIHKTIVDKYKSGIVNPGEMVGPIAAQSIGEPATQMTLNTFHYAGVSSKSNVTRGIPRLKELMNVTANLKNPASTIYLKNRFSEDENKSNAVKNKLEYTELKDIVSSTSIYYDKEGSLLNESSICSAAENALLGMYREFSEMEETCDSILPWIIKLKFDNQSIMDKGLLMEDIANCITLWSKDIKCIFTDDNSNNLFMRLHIKLEDIAAPTDTDEVKNVGLMDQSDIIASLKNIESNLLKIVIKGIPDITNIILTNMNTDYVYEDGDYICKNSGNIKCKDADNKEAAIVNNWVLETDGVNLQEIMTNEYVDFTKCFSNDILEMQKYLGIEAARNILLQEMYDVVDSAGEYVNLRHLQLDVDLMTCRGNIMPTSRQGINKGDNGPLAKMSFEDTTEQIMKAGMFGDKDNLKGVSANIMMGQVVPCGTGNFTVLLDEEIIKKNIKEHGEEEEVDDIDINVEKILDGSDDEDSYCNDEHLDFSFNVE